MEGSIEDRVARLEAELAATNDRAANQVQVIERLYKHSRAMLAQIARAHADECACAYCTAYREKLPFPRAWRDVTSEDSGAPLTSRDE